MSWFRRLTCVTMTSIAVMYAAGAGSVGAGTPTTAAPGPAGDAPPIDTIPTALSPRSPGAAAAVVGHAGAATQASSSANVVMIVTISGGADLELIGTLDLTTAAGSGVLLSANLPASARFAAQFPGLNLAYAGNTLYVHGAGTSNSVASLDGGKPWGAVTGNATAFWSNFVSPAQTLSVARLLDDPLGIMQMLAVPSATVINEGGANIVIDQSPEVYGVATEHYRYDFGDSTSTEQALGAESFLLGDPNSGGAADVWIDAAGRMRQMTTAFTVGGTVVHVLLNLADFGVGVPTSSIDPSQVGTFGTP